jgi:hypothetical protein
MAVSNADIQAWTAANPAASHQDIYNAMQQHGVTPDQLAQATGWNQADVTSRYNALTQPTQTNSATPAATLLQTTTGSQQSTPYYLLSSLPEDGRNPGFGLDGMNIKKFMDATGSDFITASELMYGVVGSNKDYRDWNSIMSSPDAIKAAKIATSQMYGGLTGKVGEYTDPQTGKVTYSYDLYGGDGTQLRSLGGGLTYEDAIKAAQSNKDGLALWGLNDLPNQNVVQAFSQTEKQQIPATKQATDADIRAWVNANPYAQDKLGLYVTTMQEHGVSPERLASVMGWNVGDVISAYNSYGSNQSMPERVKMVIPKREVKPDKPLLNTANSSSSSGNNFTTNELKVAAIADKANPLVQQAMARARQSFAGRGLLNTSMAEQAAQEAAISKALEIASPDTAAYYTDQRDAKQFDYQTALNQQSYAQQEYMARLNNDLNISNAQAQYDMKVGDTTHTNYLTMIDRIQQDTTKQVQQINSSAMPYTEKEAAIKNIQAQAQAQIANANQLFKTMNGWQDSWAVAADSYGWSTASLPTESKPIEINGNTYG